MRPLPLRLWSASLRSQMEDRASFVTGVVSGFVLNGVEFLGVASLFASFGGLTGWSLAEVGLFYGLVNVAFSLTDVTSRGFDVFADTLRSGGFDRVLLRPRAAAMQVAFSEFRLRPVGRLAQGALVIAWAAPNLAWTPERVALAAASVAGAYFLFYGLLVFQATLAFWTIDSLEMMNSLTYGGVYAAGYPMDIYPAWFRRFFTAVVPLACVSWFPVLGALGRDVDPLLAWGAPLAGPAFLLVALGAWRLGVRRYESSG